MQTIKSFRKKMLQLSIFWYNQEIIEDLGHVLIDAFDSAQSQNPDSAADLLAFFQNSGDFPKNRARANMNEQANVAIVSSSRGRADEEEEKIGDADDQDGSAKASEQKQKAFGERSWIPKNLSDGVAHLPNLEKDSDFIKYRLNNPRVTKKGDKVVSESMCNAYFEQRRNVLTQLLQSYKEDDVVIHPLVKKYKPKNYRSKTIGSKFRGVSKNKHKWQVMIMGNFKKFYIGGIKTELEAARLYDKLAIFYHGMEAKTNFKYTRRDIEVLIAEPIDSYT